MSRKFIGFHIKRYRSLLDVKLDFDDNMPITICGENNIGKTNFLRALNVYFNHFSDESIFQPEFDIPHHIYYGSQGAGAKTELIGFFKNGTQKEILKIQFNNNGESSYYLGKTIVDKSTAEDIISDFKYLFIESNNIDLPKLISTLLERDGFLKLDKKRTKQSKPLSKLQDFIKLSQDAISDIEKEINAIFKSLTDFDGILSGNEIKINFAEFGKLRDIVKTMTSITLFDGNNHKIALKGSGAQRAVFLTLIQFISKNSRSKIIWGVDEPEVFLQPSLQKKVYDVLKDIVISKKQPVILTTHSQHFIDLQNLKNTYLFEGKISERRYKRKENNIFFEINTHPIAVNSDFQKMNLIKKHLGVKNNDGWEVMPYNIIVEGEEDKKYIELIIKSLDMPVPNIIFSGGASKIAGYLQFYNMFANDLKFKPEFVCLFDNDKEGREQASKIKPKSLPYISVEIVNLVRYDGATKDSNTGDWEIEDFIPPNFLFQVINTILKKEKYKAITKKQILERSSIAHQNKQILKYVEECLSQNNPTKQQLEIDNAGRKKLICQKFCESVNLDLLKTGLTPLQVAYIKKLVK